MSKELIEREIDHLKFYLRETKANSIKIIENVGEFSFVIKFPQFKEFDVTLSIQIPSTYILNDSIIIVNQPKVKENDVQLNNICKSIENLPITGLNEPVLVHFYMTAYKMINEYCVNSKLQQTKEKTSPKNKKNPSKITSNIVNIEGEKLSSMKTAGDVVKRIQWNLEIDQDYIRVGYLDRFLGIKECSFSTFDWGDIVLADLGALAIPEHRICYFLYKGEKVWDKSERLDNVYGSTGSGITIYDVIKRLEDKIFEPQNDKNDENESNLTNDTSHFKSKLKERPNYFISIPIQDKNIVSRFEELINDLLESNPCLSQFVLPSTSLHVTLCTLRIDSKEEITLIEQTLRNLLQTKEFQEPLEFKFQGFDYFYDKVLYIKCVCDLKRLKHLKAILIDSFQHEGLSTTGNYYDFVPHLTVFKLSNNEKESAMDMIDYSILQKYDQNSFGTQNLDKLELCKMVDIYSHLTYPVEFSIKLKP